MADKEDQQKYQQFARLAADELNTWNADRIALGNAIAEAGIEEIDGPISIILQHLLGVVLRHQEMFRLIAPQTDEDHLLAWLRAANTLRAEE